MLRTPAGVDNSEVRFFDPERQFEKPIYPLAMQTCVQADLGQKSFMLPTILLALGSVARAKVEGWTQRILRRPGDSVQLVVSHHSASGTSIDHVADELECSELPWSAINKVAHEDCRASRVTPSAFAWRISKLCEECFQLVCMTVYISNNVVAQTAVLSHSSDRSVVTADPSLVPARGDDGLPSSSQVMLLAQPKRQKPASPNHSKIRPRWRDIRAATRATNLDSLSLRHLPPKTVDYS